MSCRLYERGNFKGFVFDTTNRFSLFRSHTGYTKRDVLSNMVL
jgi:hypothetical protein